VNSIPAAASDSIAQRQHSLLQLLTAAVGSHRCCNCYKLLLPMTAVCADIVAAAVDLLLLHTLPLLLLLLLLPLLSLLQLLLQQLPITAACRTAHRCRVL
jgi:hypothetical protein